MYVSHTSSVCIVPIKVWTPKASADFLSGNILHMPHTVKRKQHYEINREKAIGNTDFGPLLDLFLICLFPLMILTCISLFNKFYCNFKRTLWGFLEQTSALYPLP